MPELGGKALAGELGVALRGLKRELENLRMDAAGAVTELTSEIAAGKQGVRLIREEASAVRGAFSEIVGNGGDDGGQGAGDKKKEGEQPKAEGGDQAQTGTQTGGS